MTRATRRALDRKSIVVPLSRAEQQSDPNDIEQAFAVFIGSLLTVPAAGVLLPALGFPEGFLAAGLVVGVCVFLVLAKAASPERSSRRVGSGYSVRVTVARTRMITILAWIIVI